MASLLERVQNVFDNHQDREREQARQEGYQQALYQARDAMLGSALQLKNEWTSELSSTPSESQPQVHARYEARIQGLNDAFAALRQSEPGITTQVNPDEFREAATRQTHSRKYQEPDLSNSPYHLAYAATRRQLDTEFARSETTEVRQQLVRETTMAANRHLATPYPADDREAGMRQATVDWAHRHDDRRELRVGSERPIQDSDQYQAGYGARFEALERKLDAWLTSNRVSASKDTERQAVHDMAIQASQRVRDNWGDRGSGPERLTDPDYDRGQRKAIMDWSHEHNQRLATEQHRVAREERTREVHEYGISY
jgi:hypothetical protein